MIVIGMKTNPERSADDADLKLKFLRAGLRGWNVPTVFWGTKFLLAISLPVAFLAASTIFLKTLNPNKLLFISMFFAVAGLFLPDIWLSFRTSRRKEKLSRGFPDALDLLVVCVEAGMGLDAAISRVGMELELSHPELSRELNFLNLELRAGKSPQKCQQSSCFPWSYASYRHSLWLFLRRPPSKSTGSCLPDEGARVRGQSMMKPYKSRKSCKAFMFAVLVLAPAAALTGCTTSAYDWRKPVDLSLSDQADFEFSRDRFEAAPEDPALLKTLPEMTAEDYEASGDAYLGNEDYTMAFVQYEKAHDNLQRIQLETAIN